MMPRPVAPKSPSSEDYQHRQNSTSKKSAANTRYRNSGRSDVPPDNGLPHASEIVRRTNQTSGAPSLTNRAKHAPHTSNNMFELLRSDNEPSPTEPEASEPEQSESKTNQSAPTPKKRTVSNLATHQTTSIHPSTHTAKPAAQPSNNFSKGKAHAPDECLSARYNSSSSYANRQADNRGGYRGQSRQDQLPLDATLQRVVLERAKNLLHKVDFVDEEGNMQELNEEWLIEMEPEEVFRIVNKEAQAGNFFPLSLLNQVIKKFCNERKGKIEDAEWLYELIKKRYSTEMTMPSHKFAKYAKEVHVEMMQVYIRREAQIQDGSESHLLKIWESYRDPYTYNTLLEYFNEKKRYTDTIAWYKKWSEHFPNVQPDKYAYRFALIAYRGIRETEEFNQLLEDIVKNKPDVLYSSRFSVFYMNEVIGLNEPERLKMHVEQIQEHFKKKQAENKNNEPEQISDQVCRVYFRSLVKANSFVEAINEANHWRAANLSDQSASEVLKLFYHKDPQQCLNFIERLKNAPTRNFVKRSIKENPINNEVKLDLHLHGHMGGGGVLYGAREDTICYALLYYVRDRLLVKMSGTIKIVIVTGKGKSFEMRSNIENFICRDAFGWGLKKSSDNNDSWRTMKANEKNKYELQGGSIVVTLVKSKPTSQSQGSTDAQALALKPPTNLP